MLMAYLARSTGFVILVITYLNNFAHSLGYALLKFMVGTLPAELEK
jgi:hypothetical protein